jgi:hypothetical protein
MKFPFLLSLCFACCVGAIPQPASGVEWRAVAERSNSEQGDIVLIQHEEPVAMPRVEAVLSPVAPASPPVEAVNAPQEDYVYLPGSDPIEANYPNTGYPVEGYPDDGSDFGIFDSVTDSEPEGRKIRVGAFADYLYLRPRDAAVAFAAPYQNNLGFPLPFGSVATVDPQYTPGYRFGAFVTVCPDTTVRGTYTTYSNSSDQSIAADPPTFLVPLVTYPPNFFNFPLFNSESATANYKLDVEQIDLDYEVISMANDRFWVGYVLGARYAVFDQNFNATFGNANLVVLDLDSLDVTSTVQFKGIGVRGGVQGERSIFANRGLRVYGKGILNLLAGEFTSNYTMQSQTAGIDVRSAYSEDRIVPVVDLEAGLAWVSKRQRVRISGGYMLSAWYNIVSTNSWIQGVQQQNFSSMQDHLTFDGLVARAEVQF